MHFPEGTDIGEFRKHQETLLPFTSQFLGQKNLEIGCGNGITSLIHKEILGIEPTLCDIVDIRNDQARSLPFSLITGNALPFADHEFDSAYIQYVLHHIPTEDVSSTLREAFRVAKRLVIVEEVVGEKTDIAVAEQFDLDVNKKIYARADMPVHHYYTPEELRALFAELGHTVVSHQKISEGMPENGFLETHLFVAE